MNEINWPDGYVPGFCDNYASNEVIVAKLTVAEVWPVLTNASQWASYYANASNVRLHDGKELGHGTRFSFETFGVPVEAEVVECVPPGKGAARLAWHAWAGDGDERVDVHHAWLLEDLSGGRIRVLTQETQNGKAAREMARMKHNPAINAHQDWLVGLIATAQKRTSR